jgi:hypothetical protein
LGGWLASAIAPNKTRLRDAEATGREIGRELASEGGGSAEQKMHTTPVSLGVQPNARSIPRGT